MWEGTQQLTLLLPVSGPEPHLCSSSSLPFLAQPWATPEEPPWTIVTPMKYCVGIALCTIQHSPQPGYIYMSVYSRKSTAVEAKGLALSPCSTTAVKLRWEAACILSLIPSASFVSEDGYNHSHFLWGTN